MTTETKNAIGLDVKIETKYCDGLERDASPEWRCYHWHCGEIIASGSGPTREAAEQEAWSDDAIISLMSR
jgi:hypothetical protein